MMTKRSHRPYKFQDIKHSVDGIISCCLGILAFALTVGEFVITIRTRGQVGGMAGFMGFSALLISVIGLIFAIISWKDEDAVDFSKRVGTLVNIILILISLAVIILGIMNLI